MQHNSLLSCSSREEVAQREIGHTDISPRTGWCLIGLFLLTIFVPSIAQLASELVTTPTVRGAQRPNAVPRLPSSLQLLNAFPAALNVFRQTPGFWSTRLLAANQQLINSTRETERQIEQRSLLNRFLLGPTRQFMVQWGGQGSDQVAIGHSGWLFFRPDIEYLTRPGFLTPHQTSLQETLLRPYQPPRQRDPRPAILEFHRQLAKRGIRLIILPTPAKPSIYPENLTRRLNESLKDTGTALQNPSFEQFQRELESAGLIVFDPAPIFARFKRSSGNDNLYLHTDTHWTPFGMELVARRLSEFIEQERLLPATPKTNHEQRPKTVVNLGDIAQLLGLPSTQKIFPSETVTIRQIQQPWGERWQPDQAAEVLLLGDSFSNIYSLPELNWGSDAGFAEQLSFHLQREVDRIAQNDGGSFATRQSLFQELAQGHDRLAGKRIVIWQFAARELVSGDWKLLPMPTVPSQSNRQAISNPRPELFTVQGTVLAVTKTPYPGSVPYRDALISMHLGEVHRTDGSDINREVVVYLWGLQDNQLDRAAQVSPGTKVQLKLAPWDTVRNRYERFNRIELDDPDFQLVDLPIYWVEEVATNSFP